MEPLCPERRFLGEQGMAGGYADYVAVEEDNAALVPDSVSDEQASIAACAIGTVLNAVRDVDKVAIGERVLVTGAGGGLGVHAVQMARLAGAYVIAQTTAADKAPLLASLGAHDVVVSTRGEDFSAKVRERTAGEGADVLLDNVGTPLFSAMRRSLGVNGRWILIGQVTGDREGFGFSDTRIIDSLASNQEEQDHEQEKATTEIDREVQGASRAGGDEGR
ncbi:MAG: hypothetical protein EXR36_04850, partial [Betaproteobacteria bacterium]|nr:hypothetical protein [Betaproteobacteria bacterium]